jgi:transposase
VGIGVIQITPQMRILVAIEAVDGRKGIDSLARLCQEKLQSDPFSGGLFVFRSRRGTSIRVLVYDGQGFWLAQKRLSQGRFVWWPSGKEPVRLKNCPILARVIFFRNLGFRTMASGFVQR